MRQILLIASVLAVAGCGGEEESVDGGVPDLSTSGDGLGGTVSCADYCAEVMQHCTGGEAVDGGLGDYPTLSSCMHECAQLPAGTFGMTTGDTVGCRQYHGGAPAAMDPVQHCPHAGSTGAGVCGADRCQAFCELATAVCTAANDAPVIFANLADCMGRCGSAPFQLDTTQPELTRSGATLNCAFYYLTLAYDNPAPVDAGGGGSAAARCADFDPNNAARACR